MRVHFIAIGGSAMHNLALALHAKGDRVSGSDDVIFEPSKSRLEKEGLLPESFGWFPEKINNSLDAIILGMHAKEDNPELLRAQELRIPVYSYPEFLYQHSKNKTRVVIGGSHGKTTITSMILHVLDYCGISVDYMVGAQLEGFNRMVNLSDENDFIVLEGDEYLSSPIDLRPKFHLYRPNIALLSGIAWDHINVFPTFDVYKDQFSIFIERIVNGGTLVYNEEDKHLKNICENTTHPIKKIPYRTPDFTQVDGKTVLETEEGSLPLEIFGAHNMNNLAGAQWVCQLMGVDVLDFYQAISSFKGASKRLELVRKEGNSFIYKDFAHAPSKVLATTKAVREQYPNHNFVVVLELHTYSSLNPQFINEYHQTLNAADRAIVFYEPHVLEIKKLAPMKAERVQSAFGNEAIEVFTDAEPLAKTLYQLQLNNTVLLFMSSGNFGGLDFDRIAKPLGS